MALLAVHRRIVFIPSRAARSERDDVPVLGRFFPAPVAAKVPEVIVWFWVAKILTTAGGEATSDYLKTWGNIKGGATEVLVFVVGVLWQFSTRRYHAFSYWFLAFGDRHLRVPAPRTSCTSWMSTSCTSAPRCWPGR